MARKKSYKLSELLERFALKATKATGTSAAFILALSVILVWIVTGPLFHFSDTWQLVINTGTTIVTFLMVFLIQRTQNKDSLAIQFTHVSAKEFLTSARLAEKPDITSRRFHFSISAADDYR